VPTHITPFPSAPSPVSRFTLHVSRTPHRSARAKRQFIHAFTLIEIMIALGIFSLVLASIYSTWTAILRASKVGRDAAASVQRARIAIRTLEESLGSVQSFASNPNYYALLSENGSQGSLSFVSHLSKSFPRSGRFGDMDVRRVTFAVESDPESGNRLALRQNPVLMDMDEDERAHPVVLAKNVVEFQTQFWDVKQNDWVDEWKPKLTNELPVMVKVSLKLALNSQSRQAHDEITRIISLPTSIVQPTWQPRGPGGPLPQPGQQPPPPGGNQGNPLIKR
jgi:prepilin-type N-terminal cleavage/methylation domain-containing protein